jgi:uncharacterized protein (DUF433 family)
MEWREHIVADPEVLTGKPVIRGSRVAVEFVLDLLVQGWAEADICREYRLDQVGVRACLAYARARPADEKVFPAAA